jgi:hypothetical protein
MRRRVLQFAGMAVALSAALAFEHAVVQRRMIAPVLAAGLPVPAWAWATLFIPELVACFLSGWRIRGFAELAAYTAGATALRTFTTFGLGWPGPPLAGEAGRGPAAPAAVAVQALVFAVAYLLTFALARSSARAPGPEPARHGRG